MPLVEFVIGGAQKCGTSALAEYIRAQPGIALPLGKEAHVFDDAAFDDGWNAGQVDAVYGDRYQFDDRSLLHGDATPIYMFDPRFVKRIARYNPAMKWIVILRDPAERAISQYNMIRSRGQDWLPMWAALLAEPYRLWRDRVDLAETSSLRRHSYLARGRYRRQLSCVLDYFPREQVLLLKSADLLARPSACMDRVCRHLGLPAPAPDTDYSLVFQGSYPEGVDHGLVRWALRQVFRSENAWLNGSDPADNIR